MDVPTGMYRCIFKSPSHSEQRWCCLLAEWFERNDFGHTKMADEIEMDTPQSLLTLFVFHSLPVSEEKLSNRATFAEGYEWKLKKCFSFLFYMSLDSFFSSFDVSTKRKVDNLLAALSTNHMQEARGERKAWRKKVFCFFFLQLYMDWWRIRERIFCVFEQYWRNELRRN